MAGLMIGESGRHPTLDGGERAGFETSP